MLEDHSPRGVCAVLASLQTDFYCHKVSQQTELSLNIDKASTTE